MDVSPEYIKMRLAAIPDLGRGTHYLATFCGTSDLRSFIDKKGDWYVWTDEDPYYCQLERQDQLQEMVSKDMNELILLFWNKVAYVNDGKTFSNPFYIIDFTSMEQLWLAFVMKEKYNKVWGGNDWIKGG